MDSLLSRYGKSRGQQPKKCVEALGQAGHGRELTQFLLPYGNDKIAAMGIVLKVNMIAQLVLTGFAFGGVPLFGYLYGAQLRAEMKKLVRFCLIFLSALSLVLTAVLCLFAFPLMGTFVKDSAMIATGAEMLRWQAASTVFAGIVLLLTVLFQAVGKGTYSLMISLLRQLIILVPVAYFLASISVQAVWYAFPVAEVVSLFASIGFFVHCKRKMLHTHDAEEKASA